MPQLHKRQYLKSLLEINHSSSDCFKALASSRYMNYFVDAKFNLEGRSLLTNDQRDEYNDLHEKDLDYHCVAR